MRIRILASSVAMLFGGLIIIHGSPASASIASANFKAKEPLQSTSQLQAHLYIFRDKTGKFGYATAVDNAHIKPQFDWALPFSNGLAAVEEKGKIGYIDRHGDWVIEPRFDFAYSFPDQSQYNKSWAPVKAGGLWGFIDTTGQWVLEPRYEFATPFDEAFGDVGRTAIVRLDGTIGAIDTSGAFTPEEGANVEGLKDRPSLITEPINDTYDLQWYRGTDGIQFFLVRRDGVPVYAQNMDGPIRPDACVNQRSGSDFDHPPDTLPIGADVTGDGTPNLVIDEYTAGAYCCSYLHIFGLGSRFRPIASIFDGMNARPCLTENSDSAKLDAVVTDYLFFGSSGDPYLLANPRVTLEYRNGTYRLARDEMRRPLPTADRLRAWRDEMREAWTTEIVYNAGPTRLIRAVLDLIYTGHLDTAWQLARDTWPEDEPGYGAWRRDLKDRLERSPYWSEVQALTTGRP